MDYSCLLIDVYETLVNFEGLGKALPCVLQKTYEKQGSLYTKKS